MKSICLRFLVLLLPILSFAQDRYATTSDGRKVILRSNGTWQYVNNTTSTNSNTNSQVHKLKTLSTNNTLKNRKYIRGSRGGCYYINRNGGKTYVDRSLCN